MTFSGPSQKAITAEYNQPLAASGDNLFKLPKGDYIFPFELPLRRHMMDTVTGAGHQYHSYQVRSIVQRPFYSDMTTSQAVRIYLTQNFLLGHPLDQVPPVSNCPYTLLSLWHESS